MVITTKCITWWMIPGLDNRVAPTGAGPVPVMEEVGSGEGEAGAGGGWSGLHTVQVSS